MVSQEVINKAAIILLPITAPKRADIINKHNAMPLTKKKCRAKIHCLSINFHSMLHTYIVLENSLQI